MSPRTRFLSRLIGVYCLIVPLALAVRRQASVATVKMLVQDPPALLTLGIITLAAGLAIVLGHNIWSGGALPVVVTLLGWVAVLKGLLLLFLPPDGLGNLLAALHYEQQYYFYFAISIVIGAYLVYGGFRPSSAAPTLPASPIAQESS